MGSPFGPPSYKPYQPGPSNIPELLMRQGQIQADRSARSGELLGNAVAGIGQQVGEAVQQSARSKAFDRAIASGDPAQIVRVLGARDGTAVVNAMKAHQPDGLKQYGDRMEILRDQARGILAVPPENRQQAYDFSVKSLVSNKVITPEEVTPYDENMLKQLASYGSAPEKPQGPIKASPGDVFLDPNTLEQKAAIPATPEKVKRHPLKVAGPNGRPMIQMFTEEQMAAGVPAYQEPKEGSTAKFWVMREGKPLRVNEGEYRPGDAPASTREQGRPVTSGDAGKIADFDTSLDDLNKLAGAVGGSKATGTSARIGAAVPNFVTEWTGFGSDAKAKQATIDRVKQVIGKALEGGVLRKEDEYKYEKILPTIGDPAKVVQAKMDGLWKAIQLRKQTTIESLSDAGYDTAKFAARTPRQREGVVDPLGIR